MLTRARNPSEPPHVTNPCGPVRPLNLLQVFCGPFPLHQGTQVAVRTVCESLAARGHRVVLACYGPGRGFDPPGVQVVRSKPVPGGSFTRAGPHWSRPIHDAHLARVVRRLATHTRFDVVHAHHIQAPLVALAGLAGLPKHHRPPVIYHAHTHLSEELPSYMRGAWAKTLAAQLGRGADALVPRLVQGCMTLSERSATAMRSRCSGPVQAIPLGVHAAEVTGADGARARRVFGLGSKPWVVYTGNTDAYQDLPDLFRAMTLVRGADLLVVTGDAPVELQRSATCVGLPAHRLRVIQRTAWPQVRDLLAAGAIAVLPRRRCAGFPVKLVNALALGVPVVAAGDSARALPGVIAVPGADAQAMAKAIQELLGDAPRRQRLGRQGQQAFDQTFTAERMAQRIEGFYRILDVQQHAFGRPALVTTHLASNSTR